MMVKKKSLEELALASDARFVGEGATEISSVAEIQSAKEGDITFIANVRYKKHLASTGASAVIVAEGLEKDPAAAGKNLLVAKDPYLSFAKVLALLNPEEPREPGIHPSAVVSDDAQVDKNASIGPCAVIEENAQIGPLASIGAGAYVGKDARVGKGSLIYPNVSIRESVTIGERVIIHCGTVVGSDGFGYARQGSSYVKVPQRGTVVIEDDVEIGASVTIDRGTIGPTVIGRGTKIDNLVQIAHNVKIGEDCAIVAQVGISGSTVIGDRVTVAGQSGFAGHIEVADDCTFGAKSGITNDVKQAGVYTGYPALPHREWLRSQASVTRLPEIKKKLRDLEDRIKGLEKKKN